MYAIEFVSALFLPLYFLHSLRRFNCLTSNSCLESFFPFRFKPRRKRERRIRKRQWKKRNQWKDERKETRNKEHSFRSLYTLIFVLVPHRQKWQRFIAKWTHECKNFILHMIFCSFPSLYKNTGNTIGFNVSFPFKFWFDCMHSNCFREMCTQKWKS